MHEVTCPVYPCVWSVVAGEGEMLEAFADVAFRGHLRSHSADEIVAGFEALTAQNTRQLAHLGALNDELNAARREVDELRTTVDGLRVALETRTLQWARAGSERNAEFARAESLAANNARLRQERDEAREQVKRVIRHYGELTNPHNNPGVADVRS